MATPIRYDRTSAAGNIIATNIRNMINMHNSLEEMSAVLGTYVNGADYSGVAAFLGITGPTANQDAQDVVGLLALWRDDIKNTMMPRGYERLDAFAG
jgi:hypothetical protein